MQGTRVQNLFQEDPIYCVATKPVHYNYWTHTLRAYAPQQEKLLQWEAHMPQPVYNPPLFTTRGTSHKAAKTQHSKD